MTHGGDIVIRTERNGDERSIRELIDASFANAAHSSGTEAAIVEGLREAEALSLSLVACDDKDSIVGHVALSSVAIGQESDCWYGLGPLAVDPKRQRRGIGASLVRDALERLKDLGACGCVLVGDPGYYGRFGFRGDSALTYVGLPGEFVLALPFHGPPPRGEITYHPVFDEAV